jgi:hypothetical protein
MRQADLTWVSAVVVLAAAGMLIKVSVWGRLVYSDVPTANSHVAERLTEAGFMVAPPRFQRDWRLSAQRGRCHLLAGAIDDITENKVSWERAAIGGLLRYHFHEAVRRRFPRTRAAVEEQAQRQLVRVGLANGRAAVIATIERGDCGELPNLGNIRMPMRGMSEAEYLRVRPYGVVIAR